MEIFFESNRKCVLTQTDENGENEKKKKYDDDEAF